MTIQRQLKELLQDEADPGKLERLAAALVGRLLGVSVAVASSGFQHGADAGPSGRQGRLFRLECKKYRDTTSLDQRELLGEIDQARLRDPALEAWVLITTREAPEHIEQSLQLHGESIGVPVIILDWKDPGMPSLAALCAFAPDVVEEIVSGEAAALARQLQPSAGAAIDALRRDLQAWCIGFESLRARSLEKLQRLWESPREANASLGQKSAAGGAQKKKIRRHKIHEAFEDWWHGAASNDAPAAVVGWEGVGKTWATLDWMVDRRDNLPITIVVPSSAAAQLRAGSTMEVKSFIAECLYEITGVRERSYWLRRLENLLKRPASEGPVLAIFFDGLNQERSAPWLQLLKSLQGEAFEGRVRVILSTRTYHFENQLHSLRGLAVSAVRVHVDLYDTHPDGELDQLLAFEGLTQHQLRPDVLELARNPRLFRLAIQLKDRVGEAGQVTVHRLLWEYGRDTLGHRDGRAFSEEEWREWLQEIAGRYRAGIRHFTIKDLGDTTARPDLSEKEVYARLSDIIDGRFAIPQTSGKLQLNPTVVAHSLGAALLAYLEDVASATFDRLDVELTLWLDPIAGLDQRAEILRAAVSILVERDAVPASPVAGVLVTAWLQTQNVSDEHRLELAALATILCDALLDCVEHSMERAQASARLWAINALQAIPRTDGNALAVIVGRACRWIAVISRDIKPHVPSHADYEKRRVEHLIKRIGRDANGPLRLLGLDFVVVDWSDGALAATVPSILEGFPLAVATEIFEAAAIAMAVSSGNREFWDGLKWLCLLNDVDAAETTAALRTLSGNILKRPPEKSVSKDLPVRAAAFLLKATGDEIDETEAAALDGQYEHYITYERDYLAAPGRSLFPLERRHAELVLSDTNELLGSRIMRTRDLWLDPDFEPPASFAKELTDYAVEQEILERRPSAVSENFPFEEFEPALARCAPKLLTKIIRHKVGAFRTCSRQSRYLTSPHCSEYFLLAGEAESEAAGILRSSIKGRSANEEAAATLNLLTLEVKGQSFTRQVAAIIEAGLNCIFLDLCEILEPPLPNEVDDLIRQFAAGTEKQVRDLLILLAHSQLPFSETSWQWLLEKAFGNDVSLHGLAYLALSTMDTPRFGSELRSRGWTWSPDADSLVNHYGSGGLLEVMANVPFEQLMPRLAPWRLLEAARLRGAEPCDLRLAVAVLDEIISSKEDEVSNPGEFFFVERNEATGPVSVRSNEYHYICEDMSGVLPAPIEAKALNTSAATAADRFREEWIADSNLNLINVSVDDLEAVYLHVPEVLPLWLEGCEKVTSDFRRRVRSAEAVYVSLCEVLLKHDPARGVELWRSLMKVMRITFLGFADVNDLIHIAFRAPDSPEVMKLRHETAELSVSSSDRHLLGVAIAATCAGKDGWLRALIEDDQSSPSAWRRKRGEVLKGFLARNDLPIPEAWPDHEIKTAHEDVICASAIRRFREGCAHHWWKVFLSSTVESDCYAAWVLFLRSADRRALTWMEGESQAANDGSSFFKLKMKHARVNRASIERWIRNREAGLHSTCLARDIVYGIGPWRKFVNHPM